MLFAINRSHTEAYRSMNVLRRTGRPRPNVYLSLALAMLIFNEFSKL